MPYGERLRADAATITRRSAPTRVIPRLELDVVREVVQAASPAQPTHDAFLDRAPVSAAAAAGPDLGGPTPQPPAPPHLPALPERRPTTDVDGPPATSTAASDLLRSDPGRVPIEPGPANRGVVARPEDPALDARREIRIVESERTPVEAIPGTDRGTARPDLGAHIPFRLLGTTPDEQPPEAPAVHDLAAPAGRLDPPPPPVAARWSEPATASSAAPAPESVSVTIGTIEVVVDAPSQQPLPPPLAPAPAPVYRGPDDDPIMALRRQYVTWPEGR